CKPRGFRTVLRAAGGAIPPADSPGRDVLVPQPGRGRARAADGPAADLGLEPKAAKTRIVHLEEGGEGFDFLGFHHRLVRSRGLNGKRPVTFLARWPADKAMQHARDRIRELTRRSRLLLAPEWIVEDLNRFLGPVPARAHHRRQPAR